MTPPVEVTPEHMARAYAQMRKHGTPTLDELRSCWVLYSCIRNRAIGIANGQVLPPEPIAAPATQPPVRAGPARPERRRDDAPPPAPFSSRAAAAGEYLHPDE